MDTSEPLSLSLFYLAEGEKVSILSEIGQGFKKTNCGFWEEEILFERD